MSDICPRAPPSGLPHCLFKKYVVVCAQSLSCVRPILTPWTVAHQAPLSMEFSRQAYWSGLPFFLLGCLPDLGIEPKSPTLAGKFFTKCSTWEALDHLLSHKEGFPIDLSLLGVTLFAFFFSTPDTQAVSCLCNGFFLCLEDPPQILK